MSKELEVCFLPGSSIKPFVFDPDKFRCPFCGVWHGMHGAHHCQKAIYRLDVLVYPDVTQSEMTGMVCYIISFHPEPEHDGRV